MGCGYFQLVAIVLSLVGVMVAHQRAYGQSQSLIPLREYSIFTANQSPRPYPTPVIDPSAYLPKLDLRAPSIEVVGNGQDVTQQIQAASDALDKRTTRKGIIRLRGTGRIGRRPIVNHHLIFDRNSEWFCAQQDADYGCIIIKDGVLAQGNGATIHESSWSRIRPPDIREPAIAIFQPYADFRSKHHEGLSRNIGIVGFIFKGGELKIGDGGARATLMIGNCDNCAAIDNQFINTSGIGVNWGGDSSAGNYARHCLSYRNRYDGLVAAHEAVVNGQDILIVDIQGRRPSRKGFGGGVSVVDVEPNVGRGRAFRDRAINIGIYNISCDYTGAFISGGAGNCINIQNPNSESDVHDITLANVTAYGGDPADRNSRPLSNGVFVTGNIPNLLVSNIKVTKAGQSCVQLHDAGGSQTYQDIDCASSGGGGVFAITIYGPQGGASFLRTRLYNAPGTDVSTDPRILNCAPNTQFRDMNAEVVTVGCPR